jgi:hypothetical protein
MNPTLLDIIAAYTQAESSKLAVIQQEKDRQLAHAKSLKASASAKLDEIFNELQPAIERTQQNPRTGRRPDHALEPHCHDSNNRNFWSRYDHGMCLLAGAVFDGEKFTFSGSNPRYKRHGEPPMEIEPINTHDETEFRVWLAKFLGLYIAHHCS